MTENIQSRKVLLIHSAEAAVRPVNDYYKNYLTGWNFLNEHDRSLMSLFESGDEKASLMQIDAHIKRAVKEQHIDAVMLTCSAVSVEQMKSLNAMNSIPVMKVDISMMEKALFAGLRLGLVATFVPGGESSELLLRSLASHYGVAPEIVRIFVPEAYPLLKTGDVNVHDELVLRAISKHREEVDVVILSQVSMAHLHERVAEITGKKVFSSLKDSADALLSLKNKNG